MKVLLSVLGVLVAVVAICVISYVSNYNYGNRAEREIEASYEGMESILATYSLQVVESAQVPDMMKDDLTEVLQAAMSGRYGENGSQATFQWIQENYPGQVDPSLYTQIQQIIESGRNRFDNAQRQFVDKKRAYETNLGYLWKGFWLSTAGYPTIDLENDFAIISSEHAVDAFKTKVDQGIQLN